MLALVNAISTRRPDLPAGVTASTEIKEAAEAFAKAENVIVIYGNEGLGLPGSQALAQACANLLVETNHVGRPNNGLLAVWQRANDQGAWEMGFEVADDLAKSLKGKSVYIVGADPVGDDGYQDETTASIPGHRER